MGIPLKRDAKIKHVQVPKASEILAGQLRDMIVSGQLQPGSVLPTERQMVEDSGLSRTSVRDALRVLESEGLIATKVGRSGGSRVTLPGREAAARSVELFVRTHGIRYGSLLECRAAVEPTLAGLAARHRTEEQLRIMQELHEEFAASADDVSRYKAVNLEWHLAVAHASGNEPLMALMEAIAQPISDAMNYNHVTTPDLRQGAIRAHSAILEAIEAGDESSAQKRMGRHVNAYRAIAEAEMPSTD